MKAAWFYGGPRIELGEAPDPITGPGEVLVRVKSAGICGSDLLTYRDPKHIWGGFGIPYLTGHELAGEVAALGPGVTGLQVGQRVGVEPRHLVACGVCEFCRRGDYQICADLGKENGKPVCSTGFAEYSLEPRRNVYPLADGTKMDEAGILDVYACAVHALHRVPVNPLHTVVIQGAGAIGLTAAELFRLGGAGKIIVCDIEQAALDAALKLGVDAVVNSATQDPVSAVMDLTHGKGARVVIEAVGGAAPTFATDMKIVGRGGTVLIIGMYGPPQTFESAAAQLKEVNLLWSWSYGLWEGVPEFKAALDLLEAGKLQADKIITHTFPLDQIGEAFATANNKRQTGAVKVVIHP